MKSRSPTHQLSHHQYQYRTDKFFNKYLAHPCPAKRDIIQARAREPRGDKYARGSCGRGSRRGTSLGGGSDVSVCSRARYYTRGPFGAAIIFHARKVAPRARRHSLAARGLASVRTVVGVAVATAPRERDAFIRDGSRGSGWFWRSLRRSRIV